MFDLLARTDSRLRGRKAELRPIVGNALPSLFRAVQDAVGLVREWLELTAAEPSSQGGYRARQAIQCREKLLTHLAQGVDELQQLKAGSGDARLVDIAATVALHAVRQLQVDLDAKSGAPIDGRLAQDVLHGELLLRTDVPLDDEWEPRPGADLLAAVLDSLKTDAPDWPAALAAHTAARNHLATLRIIEHLERSRPEGIAVEPLRAARGRTSTPVRRRPQTPNQGRQKGRSSRRWRMACSARPTASN